MTQEREHDRRAFLLKAIYGLWTLMAAALGVPAAAYLLLPPRPRKEPEWVEAAELSRLETGVPEQAVFRRTRADGWKISSEKDSAWLVKLADSEVLAFAPQCTHLGCAYHWQEQRQQFVCPCHSSYFSVRGEVLSGPALRPLDRYRVRLEGDKISLGPLDKTTGSTA
jgi:menaquinol-cytochrome c reductase iron-sulfur subunit